MKKLKMPFAKGTFSWLEAWKNGKFTLSDIRNFWQNIWEKTHNIKVNHDSFIHEHNPFRRFQEKWKKR